MNTRLAGALVVLATALSPMHGLAGGGAPATTSRFTRLRTPTFVLIGENGERPLRRVAERMEQFREVFGRVFPSTRQAMPAPIVVHVFGSTKAYQPFMPLYNGKRVEVGGYFQQADGGCYITLSTEAGEYAYPTIFHEYVHLLVGNALADVPVWFNEGLAEYYSTYEMSGDRSARLGRVKEEHVFDLRERFIPLTELLAVDHASPLYNEGSRRGVFYAESWALVHYLLIGNPKRQGQLASYLEKYADGVPSTQAVRQAFGVSEAELEKELRQYVQQMAYPSARYTFEDKVTIDKGWTVDQPSDADGEAAYADLLLALHRPADATARANAALGLTPGHARAQAVLGRIRAADGDAGAAATLLDQAIKAAGETDYLPAYYQARLLLRGEGKHSPTVTPDAARQALALLGRVTTLQPSLADAHGLAAYAWLVADNPKASMAAAATAFKLSQRHEYALLHARARVFLRDAGVRPALDALVARGSSDWVRREAQELIDFLARVQASEAARTAMAAAAGVDAARSTAGPGDAPGMPGGGGGTRRTIPVYRVLKGAEKRDIGLFTGIECPRGVIVFTFTGGKEIARLSAKAFDQVDMLTYRQEPPGAVSCGPRVKPELVYYTWLADGGAPGTNGVLTALELLPEDFQP